MAAKLWFRFTDYPNNANTDIPSKHRFLRSSDKLSRMDMYVYWAKITFQQLLCIVFEEEEHLENVLDDDL